jgi:hypothetical protein
MALFCFWSRRACSHYAVLGLPIPPGSSLEAHMTRCSKCREYWSGLSLLTSDLDRLLTVPHPSPWLAEPVWERVRPAGRSYHWGRASLATVAVCGVACGWVAWRLSSQLTRPAAVPVVINPTPKMPDEEPPITTPVKPEPMRIPGYGDFGSDWTIRRSPGPSQTILTMTHHRHHPGNRLARAPRQAGAPQPVMDAAALAVRWQASGLMFEAQGDPGLANVAYQAAYRDQPSEETAYDMGRSAEESGDMEQALDVYAGLLESADAKSRTEKGWNP